MLRVLAEFYSTIWAIEPAVYQQMEAILDRWSSGIKLSADQIQAAVGNAPRVADQRRDEAVRSGGGDVAVIPVYGVLTHRAYAAQQVSTQLTSTELLAATVRAAAADSQIGGIVLDVDSPGGSVFGVQELGDAIHAVRGVKPIIAVANAQAASGAYWLASQADEVVVTPSGAVGSIGAFMRHSDKSEKNAKDGVKNTYIYSGKYKVEGNPDGPLDPEGLTYLQSQVDSFYTAFVKAVARGRGVGVDVVRGPEFGEGRMVLARQAVQQGMANRVATLDQVIADMRRPAARRPGGLHASTAAAQLAVLQARSAA
jgi:signal peptide peptidase SppA